LIQLNKSTNIALFQQVSVLIRYGHGHMEDVKMEGLHSTVLETTPQAHDVMNSNSKFVEMEGRNLHKFIFFE